MLFTKGTEQNNKMSFLDVNVIREQGMSILFVNRVNLQQMPIENQLLIAYTPISIAFYLTTTKLV